MTTFALCDAVVKSFLDAEELKEISEDSLTVVKKTSYGEGQNFEWTCFKKKGSKGFLVKATYYTLFQYVLLDWFLVDECEFQKNTYGKRVIVSEHPSLSVKLQCKMARPIGKGDENKELEYKFNYKPKTKKSDNAFTVISERQPLVDLH
ncbi:uncharacterized protein LOC129003117 [Macrosteles quadrilineatus]|uniref:uncharacterized protein LOC129003117 n=1 Tax=Macrosteles quadrilineatus TaxID=74068 RepID=UPI0023E1705D|nr:uncharacterized protein LOC129003117 [Macrosteles quadrilineatus]